MGSVKSPNSSRPRRRKDPRAALVSNLYAGGGVLLTVLVLGSLVYFQLGQGRWTLWDCFYMTIVTISTVGYGETLSDMELVPGARAFTVLLILLGSGTLLYFASTITAFLVEGDLQGIIRRQRMQKKINTLSDHIILCGVGETGIHVAKELEKTQTPFVAIDHDIDRLEELQHHTESSVLLLEGDATEEEVLWEAGVHRARGLVAALHNDPENLFLTISARSLSERLRIVTKVVDPNNEGKMKRAGANVVVSPNFIGGMRMVSSMIRPSVVRFLDDMLRERTEARRIEEVAVPSKSSVLGKALREIDLRRNSDALVLAVRHPDGSHLYNPGPDFVVQEKQVLIMLGKTQDIIKIRQQLNG